MIRSQATYAEARPRGPSACDAGEERAGEISAAFLRARYLNDVFRYVLRRVPRREEAEDITAQVFAAAFEGLPRFRGQCSPYLWLLGIARRQIAAVLRQRASRRETLASELCGGFSPDTAGAPGGRAGDDADPFEALMPADEGPEAALMRAEARQRR